MNQQIKQQIMTKMPSPSKGGLGQARSCMGEVEAGAQVCSKCLSMQRWVVDYFIFASEKPGGHYVHMMLYIKAAAQMEDNQLCSRPAV